MNPLFVILAIFLSMLVGFAKGGLGGIAIIAVPLLSITMPAKEAIAVMLPLLMVGDAIAVPVYWRKWDARLLWLTLPGGIAGALVGIYLLGLLPDNRLKQVIGVLTLVYVAYKLLAERIKALDYEPPDWSGSVMGAVAGISSSLANAGGPPLSAWLLLKRVQPTQFVALSAIYFAVVNAVKLPFFIQSGYLRWGPFLSIIWAAPLVPVGVWLGRRFVRWVKPQVYEYAVLGALTLTGISLLVDLTALFSNLAFIYVR